jgi:elongation factor 1-beta
MGKVGISIKIMPENPDVNLDNVLEKIKAEYHVEDSKTTPVAFGLKSLDILILTEDAGGTDKIEDFIKNIDNVASIDIVSVSVI